MAFIDEIRETQAETIAKYEEQLRMDNDIVLKVLHEMHERIRSRVKEYFYAKDMSEMSFSFETVDLINHDKYKIFGQEISVKEYRKVVDVFLTEGFKVSQNEYDERYNNTIHHILKLTVEW